MLDLTGFYRSHEIAKLAFVNVFTVEGRDTQVLERQALVQFKVMLICVVTQDLTGRFKAGDIIRQLSEIVGGKGGGRPDMAQGGGNRPEELQHALESVQDIIKKGK